MEVVEHLSADSIDSTKEVAISSSDINDKGVLGSEANGIAVTPSDNENDNCGSEAQISSETNQSEDVDLKSKDDTELNQGLEVNSKIDTTEVTKPKEPEKNEIPVEHVVDNTSISISVVDVNPVDVTDSSHVDDGSIETEVVTDNLIEGEDVKFETEVLVVKEETVVSNENAPHILGNEVNNKILGSFDGQSIDLTEALTSSDMYQNENRNGTVQEVFNKEELLNILEGNDESESSKDTETIEHSIKKQKDLALQQLSKLKSRNRRYTKTNKDNIKNVKANVDNKPVEDNIINILVKDWEDGEPDDDKVEKVLEETEELLDASKAILDQQKKVTKDDNNTSQKELSKNEMQNLSANTHENPQQRRQSRVIKKKVIFDPDNPDTFTKGKTPSKNKESQIDNKEPLIKKVKSEAPTPRASSKSPTAKMQWKKPTPKQSKQNKRLSEVDKLLMDEGAVNMMYQLTPEANKGKKNIRTKAEFIKKINQSTTPDGKEMKFRDRKKDMARGEESEAKKIVTGKRTSLSGSIKSASACEDFETHSADDSIIYRRHSSSSYSSACMSPRRLSDVESVSTQSAPVSQISKDPVRDSPKPENGVKDLFMGDTATGNNMDIINKKDCLSLKEKLNSKLSNALNKRKRDIKTDRPSKQKKLAPISGNAPATSKTLSVSMDSRVAEISIKETGSVEVLQELQSALQVIEGNSEISITLITLESGDFCPKLNMEPLLNKEERANYALEVTKIIRCLLVVMEQHSKLLVCGVSGKCEGLGLPLLALCDLAISSESSTFALQDDLNAPLMPGIALLSQHLNWSKSLMSDLVIFGRRISAMEALQNGLLTRTLWPDRFYDQLRALVKDIAAQPHSNILLKKKLLKSGKQISPETFQTNITTELAAVSAYWMSEGGQEVLKAHLTS